MRTNMPSWREHRAGQGVSGPVLPFGLRGGRRVAFGEGRAPQNADSGVASFTSSLPWPHRTRSFPGMELLEQIVDGVALVIGTVGFLVILYGITLSAGRMLVIEARAFRSVDVAQDRRRLRHQLGYYLLLGLEFLVAADIIYTIIRPSLDELISLSIIVSIRTILSVSLNWELAGSAEVKEAHP